MTTAAPGRPTSGLLADPVALRRSGVTKIRRSRLEGPEGVRDRPLPGRPLALSEAELALLFDRIFRGPDLEADGESAWTLPDLFCWIEDRFAQAALPREVFAGVLPLINGLRGPPATAASA